MASPAPTKYARRLDAPVPFARPDSPGRLTRQASRRRTSSEVFKPPNPKLLVMISAACSDQTLEDIGQTLNPTGERVRQTEVGALRELKLPARRRHLHIVLT